MTDCLVCKRIDLIKKGANPYFVAELPTGYVVLADMQFYKGYTLFLAKQHARELHELSPSDRDAYLQDMAQVAAAVYTTFKPRKLNYELLGNTIEHLHWHLIPRYADDPLPRKAIWEYDRNQRQNNRYRPSTTELVELRNRLAQALI